MTRKIAEPMIAAARCTIGAYSTLRGAQALRERDFVFDLDRVAQG
jgi:hypothetical protein